MMFESAQQDLRCPYCDFSTLYEGDADEICKVYLWKDDGQDCHHADTGRAALRRNGGPLSSPPNPAH